MDSNRKGDFLEDAVQAIEKFLFKDGHPDIVGKILVKKRKTIEVDGVKYEIDIYASVPMGNGDDEVYIFEAKNWDANSIPPKEVYYFDKKVEVTGAQKGYFIGTKFTRSAKAMADQLPNVELCQASKLKSDGMPFMMFSVDFDTSEVHSLSLVDSKGNKVDFCDIEDESVEVKGEPRPKGYVSRYLIQKLMHKIDRHCVLQNKSEYCEEVDEAIDTSNHQLKVNGVDVMSVFISAKVCLDLDTQKDQEFEVNVKGRGKYSILTKESKGTCDIGFTLTTTQISP